MTPKLDVIDCLKQSIIPILEQEEVILFDMTFHLYAGSGCLKLLVDKAHGGITINECARINQLIGSLIEREGIIEQKYTLEVSSPGLDQPLLREQDFSRCLNRRIWLTYYDSVNAVREITGIIISVDQEKISLDLGGDTKEVPFVRIKKGKQLL